MTTTELTTTAHQIEQLRDHLLQADDLERIAFLYCSYSGNRLLVEEIVPVDDDKYDTRHATGCRPDLAVERDLVQTCINRGMHPVIIHSHPFHEAEAVPGFSRHDEELMDGLHRMVTGLNQDTTVGFAVLGQQSINTRVYDPGADDATDLPVTVTGDWLIDTPLITPNPKPAADAAINQNRYDRNIRAITARGQQQLVETHIGLVGVGGLGTIKAEEFARYGIGELTIVDPDIVEESNLPRLFGAYDHHLDRPKVEVVKEHLYRCNSDITVNSVQAPAEDAADVLKQCDLLVAGVDQISARMWLNQFAVRHLIPYVDAGVVIDTEDEDTITAMEGYIQVITPGATACFDCMDRGDPEQARIESLSDEALQEEVERGYIDETTLSPEPAVVPLNGVIASKTVQTVAKLVTGYDAPDGFLRFEGIDNTLETITIRPRATCQTCGNNGALGRGDRNATADEFDATQIDIDTTGLEAEIGTVAESSADEAGSPLDFLPEDSDGFPGQDEA